jgi:hypothetical protein
MDRPSARETADDKHAMREPVSDRRPRDRSVDRHHREGGPQGKRTPDNDRRLRDTSTDRHRDRDREYSFRSPDQIEPINSERPVRGRDLSLTRGDIPPGGEEPPQQTRVGGRTHGNNRFAHEPNTGLEARNERRPERLMRGANQEPLYDQYGKPIHAENRSPRGRDEFGEYDRFSDRSQRQHLDPNSAGSKTRSRRKLETMIRNDSLSSDPSDCVRPPPPKPHKHRKGKKQRQASLSSSDDEIQTTPECTSCEEQEIESESVSEKGWFKI